MTNKKPQLHSDWIDLQALRIIETLHREGFVAYLVGGCVRDLLIGIHPKDFDIATNALPQQIKRKVSQAYVIGKRFKLVLARRGDNQYEIATFRRNQIEEDLIESAPTVLGDNYFGTIEQDAQRRDFTINALFYNPANGEVLDFVDGLKDIENRTLRMIGDPYSRLVEDPIRILRALRLSHKINFKIEEVLLAKISECAPELNKAVLPRIREEWLKILKLNEPRLVLMQMYDLGILKIILPFLDDLFQNKESKKQFFDYLDMTQRLNFNFKDPTESFASIIISAIVSHPELKNLNAQELETHEQLNHFIKEQLGVFKQEAFFIFRALSFIDHLQSLDSFKRKGERRKIAFLSQDHFILSLKLSQVTHQISSTTFYIWLEELASIHKSMEIHD